MKKSHASDASDAPIRPWVPLRLKKPGWTSADHPRATDQQDPEPVTSKGLINTPSVPKGTVADIYIDIHMGLNI